MYKQKSILTCLMFVFLLPLSALADDYSATIKVFKDSDVVKTFFDDSYGYAVFPIIGKGGMGIGGAHGKGQVYRAGKLTGKSSISQLTLGFQLGGQAFSQIIFFQDKRAYDEFTVGNFEFSAQATAVAITAGAQAQAGTGGASASANTGPTDAGKQQAGYYKGMAIFTHAKGGLMYEASIGGQKFTFNQIK